MKKIIISFLTVMLLTACSNTTYNDYKFRGESEHWEAVYAHKGTDRNKSNSNETSHEFILTFKGSVEELSSFHKLEYTYETTNGHVRNSEEFTEPPSTVTFLSSAKGTAVRKDEVIKVNVKWGDFEESFELHNESN